MNLLFITFRRLFGFSQDGVYIYKVGIFGAEIWVVELVSVGR